MKKTVISCDGCSLVVEYDDLREFKISDDFKQRRILVGSGSESPEPFAVTSEHLCSDCRIKAEDELQEFVNKSKFFVNGRSL